MSQGFGSVFHSVIPVARGGTIKRAARIGKFPSQRYHLKPQSLKKISTMSNTPNAASSPIENPVVQQRYDELDRLVKCALSTVKAHEHFGLELSPRQLEDYLSIFRSQYASPFSRLIFSSFLTISQADVRELNAALVAAGHPHLDCTALDVLAQRQLTQIVNFMWSHRIFLLIVNNPRWDLDAEALSQRAQDSTRLRCLRGWGCIPDVQERPPSLRNRPLSHPASGTSSFEPVAAFMTSVVQNRAVSSSAVDNWRSSVRPSVRPSHLPSRPLQSPPPLPRYSPTPRVAFTQRITRSGRVEDPEIQYLGRRRQSHGGDQRARRGSRRDLGARLPARHVSPPTTLPTSRATGANALVGPSTTGGSSRLLSPLAYHPTSPPPWSPVPGVVADDNAIPPLVDVQTSDSTRESMSESDDEGAEYRDHADYVKKEFDVDLE